MKRITDFPELTTLDDADVIAGVDISSDDNVKVTVATVKTAVTGSVDGIVTVSRGGTGASNATAARTNIGAAAAVHTHTPADAGADPAGTASTAMSAHLAASDPHPQYDTSAEAQAKVDAHANRSDNPHSTTAIQVGADPAGTAAAAVAAHVSALDPHTQYMTSEETNDRIDQRHAHRTDNPHQVTAVQVGAEPLGTADAVVDVHEAAVDPHPQYETAAEVQAKIDTHASRTDNPHQVTRAQIGAEAAGTASTIMTAHTNDSNPHPQYIDTTELAAAVNAHASRTDNPHNVTAVQIGAEPLGYTDSAIATHAAAADPHTGYQKESEKGQANGYAELDSSGAVPAAQIGGHTHVIGNVTGLQAALDGKETAGAVSAHVALPDPHGQYLLESTRGAVDGVAALDSSGKLPLGELPTHSHSQYQPLSEKDAANGYAGLDADGKLPIGELPSHTHAQYETPAGAQAKVDAHANLTNNPHAVTADQVGAVALAMTAKAFVYTDGKLTSMTDVNGTKTFAYDGNGRLSMITGTGKYVSRTFNYTGNALMSIT